ncbi:MAG: amidohydrolase family protein, partial [Burkholderiales bacterium]
MPANSCDCHAHVFGPQTRFAYVANAGYIPPDATPEQYARMLTTIGCERAVLVQPSVYGTDNSCMVAALRSGVFAFRGVAVVEENISDSALRDLHDAGVRGVRINLASVTPGLTLAQA